ncbi:MAG: hypothetical protein ACREM1_15875 [Longimicrobiales bacterium]
MAFLAGGSIGTATALLLMTIVRWVGYGRGTGTLELQPGDWASLGLFVAAVVSYGALCLVMARAMIGLHRAPAWKAVLAATFAILITAILFGSVLPEGSYGWHPYLGVDLRDSVTLLFGFRN